MGVATFGEGKRRRILTTLKFGMWTEIAATEVPKEKIVENWILGDLVKSKLVETKSHNTLLVETEMGNRMITGSITSYRGFQVATWLVRSTPERAVWARALARGIVLCSWARHITHSASLHPGV